MNHQNIANLSTQYQQAYLVYCYKVVQYLQALAWLTEQQNQTNTIKVKPKSASRAKKIAQKVNQKKPTLKSLKHQEKPDVSTIVAMGFPNGAMSAAFRVAFNEILTNQASVPSSIKVEQDGFTSRDAAAKAAGQRYGSMGVKNKQEVQLALSFLGKDSNGNENWGYLTPGWGPVNSKIVDPSNLFNAYKSAGFSVNGWLHGHFDSNTKFSATDFGLVWGSRGADKTYLVDINNDVSYLSKSYVNRKWRSARSSSPRLRNLGLQGMQIAYPNGLSGVRL